MALQKQKMTQHGIAGVYWRIIQLNCNYDRGDAVATIGLYLDEDSRNAGATPLDSFKVDLSSEFHSGNYSDGEDVMKNISLKEAYKALKALAIEEKERDYNPSEGIIENEELSFFHDALDV